MENITTHEEIKNKVHEIVNDNFVDYEHARESLDDIIHDLQRFRSSLKSVTQYEKAGLL